MESNDQPDWDILGEVTDLLNAGLLEQGTPAYTAALLAVEVGYDGLTQDQKAVFDRVVVPVMEKRAADLEAALRAE